MTTQEVEIRALIKGISLEDLRSRVLELGAHPKGTRYIHDVYFCDNSCQKVEDAEMNKVGSYSVRIRLEEKDGNSEVTFNKKTITKEGDHHTWEEHEEPREDFEKAKDEMVEKGYKFFFDLEKNREKFILNDMEICLEDIVDFGLGIEVEILTTEDKSEEAKGRIKSFLKEIGISEKDIVPKSITNIIMHERAFKP